MTKAAVQDVLNEGFDAMMFGGGATFATADTGIVATLLKRAENWVKDKIGATNFAALIDATYLNDCAIDVEKYFAAWQLWVRRIAWLDGAATQGLEADKKAALLAQARTNAEKAQQDCMYWLGELQRGLGLDVQADQFGTGASVGMIETGPYPQTSTAALNYGGAQ